MRMFGFLMGLALVGAVIFTISLLGPEKLDAVRLRTGFHMFSPVSAPGLAEEDVNSGSGEGTDSAIDRPVPPIAAEPPVESAAEDPSIRNPESDQAPSNDPRTLDDAGPEPLIVEADPEMREVLPADPGEASAHPDQRWEVFFDPFRSEASALGFAGYLHRTTGREFAVRRAGPGDYRVWFLLAAGESRPERLAEIEEVTGMALAGGEF